MGGRRHPEDYDTREAHEDGNDSDSLDGLDDLGEEERLTRATYRSTGKIQTDTIYEDLSSIDWTREIAKERQRRLILEEDQSVNGKTVRFLDRTQTWVILVATGIAVGVLAASIDIVSLYLGDLKEGYCNSSFYLSKSFCCWGLTEEDVCHDWLKWSDALNTYSKGGGYTVNYLLYVSYAAALAACASLLVSSYAPYASHSGIPEIKILLSGVVIKRFLGKMTLLVKSLGLCLAVSSGLWLGKEGPLVHVAACCGSILLKVFPSVAGNEARKRDIFSAASAAGMSVAFGSPIGGVIFSLEQISYYFPDRILWHSFVCAMVSSVSLQFMNPFRTGKLVLYQVVFDRDWRNFELIPFILLGVIGGLYGVAFIRLNRWIEQMRKSTWISKYPTSEVAALAIMTALISFPNVFTRIPASRVLTDLLQECSQGNWLDLCTEGHLLSSVLLLLSAAVLGTLLSAATFGAKLPAGIILPSMTVGAALGRATGMLMQQWHRSYPGLWLFSSCLSDVDCVTPGVYAIIGASAALSGVTRMTVSLVVIMFELTGALTYVLPIMISVLVSKFVADAFEKHGIYESWIALQNYPYLDKADESFYGTTVRDIMLDTDEIIMIDDSQQNTISSINDMLTAFPYSGYPVIHKDQDNLLVGYISRNEIREALSLYGNLDQSSPVYFNSDEACSVVDSVNLRPYLDSTPFMLAVETNIRLVVNLFQRLGIRYVFFGRRGQLKGMITRNSLLRTLSHPDGGSTRHASPSINGHGHHVWQRSHTTPRNPSASFA